MHSTSKEGEFLLSLTLPAICVVIFWSLAILIGVQCYLIIVLIFNSLMIYNDEHSFVYIFVIKPKLGCNYVQQLYSQWLNLKEIRMSFSRLMHKQIRVHPCQGEHNVPPQNMPLWHKDYFGLTHFLKPQTQETL